MILSQSKIFDFGTIEPIQKRIQLTSPYEKDGLRAVYRTDAKSFVSSIGQLPDGKSLTDTRLLENNYHGPIKGHYYRSGAEKNKDYPFHSFLQCMGAVHKELKDKDTVLDVLDLSEYDSVNSIYIRDYRLIESAWMDDELLHIDTDRGDGYDMKLCDDCYCDPYRVEEYLPAVKTEHFCIEALRHGASAEDVQTFIYNYAYQLNLYRPFSIDWETGKQKNNRMFDKIMELSELTGIAPEVSYDVPKPEPEQWKILPAYQKSYCQHSRTCKDAKNDRYACICCDKFLYNRKPVDIKHQDRPDRRQSKMDHDEEEEE